ncbi:(2Fe-2S)-binding protein [Natrinema sp. CBA1119]|uniref:Rieske (2Fe-2S) protein n=1 Tax=Natrinema sp. CBA1119 TaxID=1608465 RepID=UPI000BF49093|nr:Rieske (2Fe-2S) protein [Natrinema sp. CBA1119]PGF13835.1 (2Fe-2S)-binding protein [Natrinema sp. CBA1119]
MSEHVVADADDLPAGDRLITEIEGSEIGVFNLDGEYRAYLNWCPHQGAPCCEGTVTGKYTADFDPETLETTDEWIREGEFLYCPWHAWEFDLETGECTTNRSYSLPTYSVYEKDGKVVVSVP